MTPLDAPKLTPEEWETILRPLVLYGDTREGIKGMGSPVMADLAQLGVRNAVESILAARRALSARPECVEAAMLGYVQVPRESHEKRIKHALEAAELVALE